MFLFFCFLFFKVFIITWLSSSSSTSVSVYQWCFLSYHYVYTHCWLVEGLILNKLVIVCFHYNVSLYELPSENKGFVYFYLFLRSNLGSWLYTNIDKTLLNSLHGLLNWEIGGLDCSVSIEHMSIVYALNTYFAVVHVIFSRVSLNVLVQYLPVNSEASDLDVPNWVSMYLGRKTTNPLTMEISQQIPKLVTK